ncbi:MAG: hypothetical protein ACR2NH_09015 [Solirubrobacteraceae bacterium]
MFWRRNVILGLAVAALVAVPGAGCGGSTDKSASELSKQDELRQARKEGASEQRIKQLEQNIRDQERGGGGQPPASGGSSAGGGSGGGGSTSCGGGLSVGPNTTCVFARSVREAYGGSGPGVVKAYSPATDRTYSMSCTGGSPHVCTGGNDASVYFP